MHPNLSANPMAGSPAPVLLAVILLARGDVKARDAGSGNRVPRRTMKRECITVALAMFADDRNEMCRLRSDPGIPRI